MFVWKVYQRAVKAAKHSYFSQLIAASLHNMHHVLYNTINSVLNIEAYVLLQSSDVTCNHFINFSVDKVSSLRPPTLSIAHLAMHVSCSSLFSAFLPIALLDLETVVLNAVAQFLIGRRKFEHISLGLSTLASHQI